MEWGWETKGNSIAPRGDLATGNSNIPSGMGGGTWPVAAPAPAPIPVTPTTSGKYKNAEYNAINKTWSVFDGEKWSDGIKTADLYGQLDPEVQKQHSSWWWGDQANQGDYYHQRENDMYASDAQRMGALGTTSYKFNSPLWG